MPKNLVIVESPAKAKTIEGYLGKDYEVQSSFGHVRDLPKGNNAIDIENGFTPTYEISPDKKDVVKQLKKLAKGAETIWLATDDDREGEAISWHLKEALDLQNDRTKRIVFREITKNAILNAIQSPRGIDDNLVNAQQARRILDRLVGFELSPILWKKIKTGLSAGRVQSVAVRIVVEREREIMNFKPDNYFKLSAEFLSKKKRFDAELSKKLKVVEDAESFLQACTEATFTVNDVQKKPAKKSPAAPFTTSTLQQEASRKLGYSPGRTMSLAQRLYESGKITYMRTDSVTLSKDAMGMAANEIKAEFGDRYHKARKYGSKSKNAQEAHEAIRPTNFKRREAGSNRDEQRLYELIWKRAIASQMADAEIERTIAKIGISSLPKEELTAKGEIITFEGFLNVYLESSDEEDETPQFSNMKVLPPLEVGQEVDLVSMEAKERFTKPPARFTEASLVKKLEEMGIGRPSTYAPTLSTIMKRNYVERDSREGKKREYRVLQLDGKEKEVKTKKESEKAGSEKKKLFPTDLGMVVTDFLVKHFPDITDYSFTANVEEEFDEISRGDKSWSHMIDAFYKSFHPKVEDTENIDRQDVKTGRELGTDPESGKNIIARLGRYGPLVQKGENTENEKADFASLQKDQRIETITLEDALELFKLPRVVGEFEGEEVVAGVGRYGPYVRHQGKFASIRDEDPLTITLDRAIEVIKAKREADAKKHIKSFDENPDVQILNGRWGPYIKVGRQNVRIPKEKKEEPEKLTLEECLKLAEEAKESKSKKGKKGAGKKKGSSKTGKSKKSSTSKKKSSAKKKK